MRDLPGRSVLAIVLVSVTTIGATTLGATTLGATTLSATLHAQPPAQIDRLAWLAGCWEQRGRDRLGMETWMPPYGGAMIGASRTVVGGVLREFEHLRITTDSGRLVYTALPSGQRETKFPALSVTDTSITFENLQHDFPQRIIYRKRGADSVIARIEGPGANNTTRGMNFPFKRASCTDSPAPPPT